MEIFQKVFLGNTVENYCWFLGVLIVGLMIKLTFSKSILFISFKVFQKHSHEVTFEKYFELLKKPFGYVLLFLTIYIAFHQLSIPGNWTYLSSEDAQLRKVIMAFYQMALTLSVTWMFLRFVDFFGLILIARADKTESKMDDQLIPFIKDSLKIVIVIFSIFFMLGAIFKMNVASLIAGLGIGGLAVALAAKETLENLLGSFTIFLDKPFLIGDLVKIGEIEGHIEKIGFRSTRIRTLEKSFVTVPNKKMIDSELDNLSLRTHRRARFNIGLTYDTSPEQFQAIINELKLFIDEHVHTLNGETRVRMHDFGDSSINIMVQYFVDTVEWDQYLDVRQEINYKIMEIVKKHNSDFAFPSRTVYMSK